MSITNEPTSAGFSTDSTLGSCVASGRIAASGGVTAAGSQLPETQLYGEYGLVNLVGLIPSLASQTT